MQENGLQTKNSAMIRPTLRKPQRDPVCPVERARVPRIRVQKWGVPERWGYWSVKPVTGRGSVACVGPPLVLSGVGAGA